MTKNTHHKLSEIEIAQLHHGWPQLPTELTKTHLAPRKIQEQTNDRASFRCAVCTRIATALIATGEWFQVRAKSQMPV